MRKIVPVSAVILVAALLFACDRAPVAVTQTDNAEIRVETLFSHEGCTVYRFEDGGRNHYYANCGVGGVKTMSTYCQTILVGKTPVTQCYDDGITTTRRES